MARDVEAAVLAQQIEQVEPLRLSHPPGCDPFAANPIGKDGFAFEHDDLDSIPCENRRHGHPPNPSTQNNEIRRCTSHFKLRLLKPDRAKQDYEEGFWPLVISNRRCG